MQLLFFLKTRSLRQRKNVKEPNPTLHVSKSTRLGQSHHAASIWSTLERPQQLFLAWQGRPPGGTRHRIPCRWMKCQPLKFPFVVASPSIVVMNVNFPRWSSSSLLFLITGLVLFNSFLTSVTAFLTSIVAFLMTSVMSLGSLLELFLSCRFSRFVSSYCSQVDSPSPQYFRSSLPGREGYN